MQKNEVEAKQELPIYSFGIGRLALGPWIKDVEHDMNERLPEGHLYRPRLEPGISYISGHKIANRADFEDFADKDPSRLIRGIVDILQIREDGLDETSASILGVKLDRVIASSKPQNNGSFRIAARVLDAGDQLLGERVSVEKAVLGEPGLKQNQGFATIVLGQVDVEDGKFHHHTAQKILKQNVPDEIGLKPVGPINYDLKSGN